MPCVKIKNDICGGVILPLNPKQTRPWNNFYLLLRSSIVSFQFDVVVTSNKLGTTQLSNSRTKRLELMLLLQEKYKINSVQTSDFLNSNNIRTPHNKTYNHKIVWSSIKKYKKRLDRFNNDKIIDVK